MKKYSPHRYKEKECPVCGVLHKKRWPCCSYECSHELKRGVKKTEEHKEAISASVKRWKSTPEGELTNMNLVTVMDEDDMILPPSNDDNGFYVEDGDVWNPI